MAQPPLLREEGNMFCSPFVTIIVDTGVYFELALLLAKCRLQPIDQFHQILFRQWLQQPSCQRYEPSCNLRFAPPVHARAFGDISEIECGSDGNLGSDDVTPAGICRACWRRRFSQDHFDLGISPYM